jgi:hypothetical protein
MTMRSLGNSKVYCFTVGILWPLSACGGPVLSVDDVIVTEDHHKARLVALVEREPVFGFRTDVKGVVVRFNLDDEQVGSDKTDSEGYATISTNVYLKSLRTYEARARVDGKNLRATGRIHHWRRDRVAIAVDIDNTIARTEVRKLMSEKKADDLDPVKGSRKVLEALARDYHILYLTARPRVLLEQTRHWIAKNEYPVGPVYTAPGLRQAIRQKTFKKAALAGLRHDWPNLLIGIGDRELDAEAYGASGMLPIMVGTRVDADDAPYAIILHDWRAVGAFFAANRETLTDRIMVRDVLKGEGMLLRPIIPWPKD